VDENGQQQQAKPKFDENAGVEKPDIEIGEEYEDEDYKIKFESHGMLL
jgi:hypothetical protein